MGQIMKLFLRASVRTLTISFPDQFSSQVARRKNPEKWEPVRWGQYRTTPTLLCPKTPPNGGKVPAKLLLRRNKWIIAATRKIIKYSDYSLSWSLTSIMSSKVLFIMQRQWTGVVNATTIILPGVCSIW